MKKLLFALAIGVSVQTALAQTDKYTQNMERNVAALDTAKKAASFQVLENNFERIALVEKTKWLPHYYASYCAMRSAYLEKDLNKIDVKADRAEVLLQTADSLTPNNAEVYCVKAMIAFARINVDFMTRGKKFGSIGYDYLLSAQKFDPTNPRPYFLLGQGKFSTPEQFGGDKKLGCKLLDQAALLFDNPPKTSIDPRWGKKDALALQGQCQKLTLKQNKASTGK